MKKCLHIAIAVLIFLSMASCRNVEASPFSGFVGKPYGEYHYQLRDTIRKIYASGDAAEIEKAAIQMKNLPDHFHDRQWQLEAKLLEINFQHDYRHGGDDSYISALISLKAMAQKKDNKVFSLRITRRLMDYYIGIDDIPNEVKYACMLEREMEDVTEDEFPDVIDNAYRLACLFMRFSANDKARPYLKRVLEHEVIPENQSIFLNARNDLGMIKRNIDMAMSDSLFLSLINDKNNVDCGQRWRGIGLGNLGRNAFMKKEYDKAIESLLLSYDIMSGLEDYTFTLKVASTLVQSYCRTGDMRKAALWAQRVVEIEKMTTPERTGFRQSMYECLSEYEAMRGNHAMASAYRDSCIATVSHKLKKWPPEVIYEAEKIYDEQRLAEATSQARARHKAVIFLSFLSILLAGIITWLYLLYRENKHLIEVLSLKTRQWAFGSPVTPKADKKENIDIILSYLISSKAYLDPECSLESIAKATSLNRSYVSRAVNEKYKNFNFMLNSFRIMEGLKILEKEKDIKVECLKDECGFGSVSSFYEAFRAVTGMSLKEYRGTIGPDVKESRT